MRLFARQWGAQRRIRLRHDVAVEVTLRLARWVTEHFPAGSADEVLSTLSTLPSAVTGGQDPERVQASLVIRTGGDWHDFQQRLALAQTDWRDVLVGAGLGDEDWPHRLDAVLGLN